MGKLIKWGLLSVLLVAVIIKLSLYLSVRSIMNDAKERLAPVVNISYDGITSSFDGRVGLENVTIAIPAAGDKVKIAHAELKFNGLSELLRFKERLAERKLPEQMAVSIKGLSIDVFGPLAQAFYQPPAQTDIFSALSNVACGDVKNIGANELLDMGYRTLETDGEFSYLLEPFAQKLTFNLNSDTRDMGTMQVSMSLANMSDNPADLRSNPPRIKRLSVELSDNEYQRKLQTYCAAKMGLTVDAYRKVAVAKIDKSLRQQRVALNQPVLDAYARYLADPQSLRVELEPTEGMVWDGLQFFEAKDALSMMRPVLMVNQTLVNDVGFEWVDPVALKVAAADKATQAKAVLSDTNLVSSGFVNIDALPDYVGRRMRFVTYDGMYYQGVLTRVANDKAFLTIQGGNGTAQMSLRLGKIDKVRVE
ncbi:hypothetical protein [Pseudomonas sp. M30-35]|uniref:hypothetical protein n=1 Tax=Pseudomonas sp. M30-35 TaxID=1981174 RepID=UPI000B3BFFB5|nr:hypothetical protein [Pseudomonas sp. M30-35]ARU88707.1 hypothetical protein B9K09_12360 [Pseudomonas sp. M30-35]